MIVFLTDKFAMKTIFNLQDPDVLWRHRLLNEAGQVLALVDDFQKRLALEGIKLTTTCFCEPEESGNKQVRRLQLVTRLLHKRGRHTEVKCTILLNDADFTVTVCYNNGKSVIFGQNGESFYSNMIESVCSIVQTLKDSAPKK